MMHPADLGIALMLSGWLLIHAALAVYAAPLRRRYLRERALESVGALTRLTDTLDRAPAAAALARWREQSRPAERVAVGRWRDALAWARALRAQRAALEAAQIRAQFRRARVRLAAPLAVWRRRTKSTAQWVEPVCW